MPAAVVDRQRYCSLRLTVASDADMLPCLDHQIRADAKAADYCRGVRASGAVTDHQLLIDDGHGQAVDTEAAALQSGQRANLARAAVDTEAAAPLHRDLVDYHVGQRERAPLLHREAAAAPAYRCNWHVAQHTAHMNEYR